MALQDAIDSVLGTVDEWIEFNSNRSNLLDLTFADLKGADLSGKEFINCDFSGADLENTNFDNCNIFNSDFSNAFFENTSLVNVQIKNCLFKKSNLINTVFRESTISKTQFEYININICNFKSVDIFDSSIIGSCFNCLKLEDVLLTDSNLILQDCKKIELISVIAKNGSIVNSQFLDGTFQNVDFDSININSTEVCNSILNIFSLTNSRIKELSFENCDIKSRLDFSTTKIYNADLQQYDLSSSIFYDTVFINCIWPAQKGVTNFLGVHTISPNLLDHPVQDIKGISPILRREIADAQYIREKLENAKFISRLGFFIWGATTNFGQSVFRLTIFTILLLLLLTIVYNTDCKIHEIFDNSFSSFFDSFKDVGYTFFGINIEKLADQYSICKGKILLLDRFLGFFILALWIGLSANKIGKLSSE